MTPPPADWRDQRMVLNTRYKHKIQVIKTIAKIDSLLHHTPGNDASKPRVPVSPRSVLAAKKAVLEAAESVCAPAGAAARHAGVEYPEDTPRVFEEQASALLRAMDSFQDSFDKNQDVGQGPL